MMNWLGWRRIPRWFQLRLSRKVKAEARNALRDIGAREITNETGAPVLRYQQAPIEKAHVLNLDMSDVDILTDLVRRELREKGAFQLWDLTISGYDEDPRALFEIPEVRKWYKQAVEKAPHLVAIVSQAALEPIVFSLLDVTVVGHPPRSQMTVFQEEVATRAATEIGQGDRTRSAKVEEMLRTGVEFKIVSTMQEFGKVFGYCVFCAYEFFQSCGIGESQAGEMSLAAFPRLPACLHKSGFPRQGEG